MALYARQIVLRNCGRFSVIQSDFGADYRTHTHVTGEALYASLTRGATRRPRPILVREDDYVFTRDYHVDEMPIWFTPGVFRDAKHEYQLPAEALDTTYFNAVSEVFPATSHAFTLDRRTGGVDSRIRPGHVPTYGTWQAVLPNNQLVTYAFSPQYDLLDAFAEKQTFMLGKKRTMFQIVSLSSIVSGHTQRGECTTAWLEVRPTFGSRFRSFEVLAATIRYLILRGTTHISSYVEFAFANDRFCLPDFYLEQIPLPT